MRKLLTVICILALALVAGGCGSSGGSDSSDDTTSTTAASSDESTTTTDGSTDTTEPDASADGYAEAMVTHYSTGSVENGELVIPKADAECMGPKVLAVVTVKALQEGDVTPEDVADPGWDSSDLGLEESQGEQIVDAFGECEVDIYALFAEALTQGLTPEQISCTAENVDEALAKALLVKTFSTGKADAEFEALLADLNPKCELPTD